MKKRAFALMLALALCLGLAVPGWAAGSETDTAVKQAYGAVLDSQIRQYGVMSDASASTGGYDPYTFVDKSGNVISCSSAKAENRTVQIRMRTVLIGGEVEMGSYHAEEVTQVVSMPSADVMEQIIEALS